jgi:hypothetical protein
VDIHRLPAQLFASTKGWQKVEKKRKERFDPPVVATRQPGATRPKPYGLFNSYINPL